MIAMKKYQKLFLPIYPEKDLVVLSLGAQTQYNFVEWREINERNKE